MDINCDLGEDEHPARTRALMKRITSANIACGGHAGSEDSIRRCLKLCREFGVRAGLHPGFPDRRNFGRKARPISPSQLADLLESQAGPFLALAKDEGVPVTHLKLHGALYHVVEDDPRLAAALAAYVRRRWPRLCIYAPPGGRIVTTTRRHGVKAWGEIYADRAYLADGRLVPRDRAGAVLTDTHALRERLEILAKKGCLRSMEGTLLRLEAQTICVHADSANSLRIASLLAEFFRR